MTLRQKVSEEEILLTFGASTPKASRSTYRTVVALASPWPHDPASPVAP